MDKTEIKALETLVKRGNILENKIKKIVSKETWIMIRELIEVELELEGVSDK